jgi:hypothetical protein
MLETLVTFVKSLPLWLVHVVEIMIVGVLFTAACLFLFGLYVGIRIIGRRANKIEEISFFPPKITFKVDDE